MAPSLRASSVLKSVRAVIFSVPDVPAMLGGLRALGMLDRPQLGAFVPSAMPTRRAVNPVRSQRLDLISAVDAPNYKHASLPLGDPEIPHVMAPHDLGDDRGDSVARPIATAFEIAFSRSHRAARAARDVRGCVARPKRSSDV